MRPFLQPLLRISVSRVRPVAQFFSLPSVLGVAGSSRGAMTPLRHLSADTTAAPPLRPLRHRMYDDFQEWWRRRVLLLRMAGGTAAVALVFAVYWLRTHGPPPARKGILDAFVAGSVPSEWDAKDALADVPRPELHIALAQLLRPAATDTYAVIVGEHGSGKSTAVRKAARASSADGASGVVFIEINEVRTFSLQLASCLNLDVREIDWVGAVRRRLEGTTKDDKGVTFADEPLTTWLSFCNTLTEAARDFHCIYARPMTLVIDGVHKLVEENPKFLDKLQDFAKTAADTGNLNIVFVSSDKTALVHMKSRSSWSRASTSLEVCDIPDDDATAFLERRFKLDRARAAELVRDVTGGRFSLLLDPSVAVKSVAAIRDEKYTETSTKLLGLGLEPTHPFFQALAVSKVVKTDAAFKLLGGKEKIEALLAANIIAAHVDGTYTVHSRYVATFLEKAQSQLQPNWTWSWTHL